MGEIKSEILALKALVENLAKQLNYPLVVVDEELEFIPQKLPAMAFRVTDISTSWGIMTAETTIYCELIIAKRLPVKTEYYVDSEIDDIVEYLWKNGCRSIDVSLVDRSASGASGMLRFMSIRFRKDIAVKY